jgi:DNA ligase-1
MKKTLYKIRSDGKVQEWTIETQQNKYRTVSGIQGGAMVTSEWTVCKGKNLSRANETTPEQQAESEADSIYKDKLSKKYTLAPNQESSFIAPMLAKDYNDYKSKLVYPVFVQPKLDGLRCITDGSKLLSRNNKEYVSCPHILRAIETFSSCFAEHGIRFLDGELYNHELKNDFNSLVSLIKRTKPDLEDILAAEKKVQYWMYDICTTTPMSFAKRNELVQKILGKSSASIVIVDSVLCKTSGDVEDNHATFLSDGFEGTIVRQDKPYENKRSSSLLKLKDFCDEEFPIVDIEEGDGNRSGKAGRIVFAKNGKRFASNIKGTMEYLTELLANKSKFIGKTATVKFFNYTPDGVPRFPVVTKIAREDTE